jgi:hypothetical protein
MNLTAVLALVQVSMGLKDRALMTTPPGMSIRKSSNPNAGLGAWTDVLIPGKTILGYYAGRVVPASTVTDGAYAWSVSTSYTAFLFN